MHKIDEEYSATGWPSNLKQKIKFGNGPHSPKLCSLRCRTKDLLRQIKLVSIVIHFTIMTNERCHDGYRKFLKELVNRTKAKTQVK